MARGKKEIVLAFVRAQRSAIGMIWAQACVGNYRQNMICLTGSLIMAAIAFAFGWLAGSWHQAKKGLKPRETEVTDQSPEEESQAESKEELEASSPDPVKKEASFLDVETLFVSRRGTKVHYFSHCSGLASADRTSLERMQICKFCKKMLMNMNPGTMTSCEQPGSSTDSGMREKSVRKRCS